VPCSVLGGATRLSSIVYHPVVGVLLLIAAWQMARSARRSSASAKENTPPVLPSLITGGRIGFVAGVTGIDGGILLAPLMLMLSWADAREIAAASAAFNLLNSAAALAGLCPPRRSGRLWPRALHGYSSRHSCSWRAGRMNAKGTAGCARQTFPAEPYRGKRS
jgi:uncharacterized membrane protein YfcA